MAEPDLTEEVTIQHPVTKEELTIPRGALPFYVNSEREYVVLDSRGRVSGSATNAAKEN